jgi:hypothetical protein
MQMWERCRIAGVLTHTLKNPHTAYIQMHHSRRSHHERAVLRVYASFLRRGDAAESGEIIDWGVCMFLSVNELLINHQ